MGYGYMSPKVFCPVEFLLTLVAIIAFAPLMCFANVPGQAEFLTEAFTTGGTMKAVNFSVDCLLMPF